MIKSIFTLGIFLMATALNAQTYTVSSSTEASVVGTSTIHDWESKVESVSGKGDFIVENGNISQVENLSITFKAKSIESGKSKMNSLTYEALEAEVFPNITFKLNSIEEINGNKIIASGDLTIAGETKRVRVQGVVTVEGDVITITGSKKIDMTEYGIEPPTAMFGTIKVGKDVNVLFTLKLTN